MRDFREQNFYELLEVKPHASPQELERSYRRARRFFSSDSVATYALFRPDELNLLRRRIEEAYRVLSDPERRRMYDRELAALQGEIRVGPPLRPDEPVQRDESPAVKEVPGQVSLLPDDDRAAGKPGPAGPAAAGQKAAGATTVEEKEAEDEAAQDRPAEDEAAEDEAAEDEAAEDEVAEDRPAEDEAAQDRSAEDEAAEDEAAGDEAAEEKAAEDEAAEEKAAEEATAGEEASAAAQPEPTAAGGAEPGAEERAGEETESLPEADEAKTPEEAPGPEPEEAAAPSALPPMPEITGETVVDGTLMRQVREARGISLHEIADITKIAIYYLRNLEQNVFEDLPAPVYVRGYLRQIAAILELDSEWFASGFLALIKESK